MYISSLTKNAILLCNLILHFGWIRKLKNGLVD